jgi:hypothetical protein
MPFTPFPPKNLNPNSSISFIILLNILLNTATTPKEFNTSKVLAGATFNSLA